jgi:hypothetical protein
MPSLRALLLTLLLVILAVFIIVLFMKKSKPEQDAQSYAEQNPECSEIKIHSKKNDLVECFLNFESASDLPADPHGEDTLYIPMVKFIGERLPGEFPLRVRLVFSFPNKILESIGISGKSITINGSKDSIWRNEKNGCKFPGFCPVMPLKGSAISQKFVKEDNNAERIFRNKFSSIGEAPVNAILPGKILKIEHDSLFSVTIYHGENIYSKTSGLGRLSNYAHTDSTISQENILGFLPSLDTAFIFLEIRHNGKYELWEGFYSENRD